MKRKHSIESYSTKVCSLFQHCKERFVHLRYLCHVRLFLGDFLKIEISLDRLIYSLYCLGLT